MDILTATTAGSLAAQINVATGMLNVVKASAASNYAVMSGSMVLQDAANDTQSINILPLTAAETAILFQTINGIFQARVTTLTSQLSGM